MLHKPTRRGLIFGLAGVFAAPAIVRSESLMKILVPNNITKQQLLSAYLYDEINWQQIGSLMAGEIHRISNRPSIFRILAERENKLCPDDFLDLTEKPSVTA